MKTLKYTAVLILLFLPASFGYSQEQQDSLNWDALLVETQRDLKTVLIGYDKIWPKGYKDLEVQFSNGEDGWLLTEEKLEKYTDDNKPTFLKATVGYTDVKDSVKSILQIVVSKDLIQDFPGATTAKKQKSIVSQFVSPFIYHEAFHFFIQDEENGWHENEEKEKSSRATSYPINPEPRIYRNHIYRLLIKAYNGDTRRNVEDAKYWFDKYINEYKDEYAKIASTDRSEGTARYVEYISDVYLENGFDASRVDTKEKVAEVFERIPRLTSTSHESYELGFLAGILLDLSGPSWKLTVHENGITPLELLFEDVNASSLEPTIEGDYVAKLEEKAEELNSELKKPMETLLAISKGESVDKLLYLPKAGGSFRADEFFAHSQIEGSYLFLKNYVQTIEDETGSIIMNNVSAFSMPGENGCSYEGSYYVLLTEESAPDITMETRETTQENGQTVLCITSYEN